MFFFDYNILKILPPISVITGFSLVGFLSFLGDFMCERHRKYFIFSLIVLTLFFVFFVPCFSYSDFMLKKSIEYHQKKEQEYLLAINTVSHEYSSADEAVHEVIIEFSEKRIEHKNKTDRAKRDLEKRQLEKQKRKLKKQIKKSH